MIRGKQPAQCQGHRGARQWQRDALVAVLPETGCAMVREPGGAPGGTPSATEKVGSDHP